MDPNALQSELSTDPAKLGYAALVNAGSDQGVADLGNSLTGPGAALCTMASMSRDDFLTAILPAGLVLAAKDALTQAKWDRLI